MDVLEADYRMSLGDMESRIVEVLADYDIPTTTELNLIEKSKSTLDGWDYCYALAVGLAGVAISTNEALAKYLDEIHKAASGSSGEYDRLQTFLGNLLHHEGDHIDIIERPFKDRNGGNAYCIFHRLLWGHDILSIKGDNPFVLMFQQQGMSGILQAVRHLLADTTSKQGLPMPGSSFLDVVDKNDKTSNYLIKIAQELSDEAFDNKLMAQEVYSHMMTIRAQDVAAGTVVKLLSELYFKLRKITDDLRCTEIKLIAYTVNFLGEAIVGCTRQNGVPYINIPLGVTMATTFGKFCYINAKEIQQLTKQAEAIHAQAEELLLSEGATDGLLPEYSSAADLLFSMEQAEANVNDLFMAFRENAE